MISVKFLRSLGYLKITEYELDIELMSVLNNQLYDLDVKAWSTPDKFIKVNGEVGYEAFKKLLEIHVGVNINSEITNIDRRTFKNTWNLLWKNYCTAVSYPENVGMMLSELGLRLAFTTSEDAQLKKAKQFYNDIINWFLYSATEVDIEDVLRVLVAGNLDDLRRLYGGNNN